MESSGREEPRVEQELRENIVMKELANVHSNIPTFLYTSSYITTRLKVLFCTLYTFKKN